MRSNFFKGASALTLAIASLTAQAADGTVTINGSVSNTTCTVSVNGGSSNGTVTLPTVGVTSLNSSVGQVAGATSFSIGISGCTTSQTSMAPYFEASGSSAFNAQGRFTTSVSGVDIEILNSAGNAVNLGGSSTVSGGLTGQNVPTVTITGSNPSKTALSTFTARYRSTSTTVGNGAITVNLAYTIIYQ
jgi:major type 1 subunit fimbrin (pilin)